MYSTDPIADMLTRIRNALLVGKHKIELPYSQLKEQIAKVLVEHSFLTKVEAKGAGKDKQLVIVINKPSHPAKLSVLERISKPGLRVYTPVKAIPVVKNGRGMVILSTSQGIMTGQQASTAKLGGEVLCSVY